ncbi:DNA repair exonuclease [Parapusillimonas sp. SGNA-6]|nr:DNA repair exonuclease [Parapusillimonas sp. SGNA-6]
MKFIHAADIHLDSPLTGLSAYADAPAAMLRTATRAAFTNLVTTAIDEGVDFVVIAGDLYDGNWKDHNTGLYFVHQMGRLRRAGISAYVLYGNHDADSEMTRKLVLPDNVHVFESRRPTTFVREDLNVALHGRSFKVAATTDNLVTTYPPPVAGLFNIGVLHTALEGNAAHANYAPCSLDELHAKGYQYWALGHVHEYKRWDGPSTVVFPGNLQGRNIRETGEHGAVLVHVDEGAPLRVERLAVDVLRWALLPVDVSGAASLNEVVRKTGNALETLMADDGATLPLAVRVQLVGQTPAHGELFGREHQLRAEVLGQVLALGSERLWLEKVRLATQAPADIEALDGRADALADLQDLLREAQDDPDFIKSLQTDLMGLVGKAPLELQTSVPGFQDIRDGKLAALLDEVRPALMAHLAQSE